MAMQFYDLAGADPLVRFSPYCWRIRMALAHKGLDAETIPWRFSEKAALAFSGQSLVPVLVDGKKIISDSWTIAEHLEDAYPSRPPLFEGDTARALTRFVNAWTDSVVHPLVARLVVRDILDVLGPEDQAYFRQSREARLGATLEAFVADRDTHLAAFRRTLQPARLTLQTQPFLAGPEPGYADYILFGAFQWARSVSPLHLLEAADPVHAWREQMLDLFGGLARSAKGYEV
jgi:glutathione S-transferase